MSSEGGHGRYGNSSKVDQGFSALGGASVHMGDMNIHNHGNNATKQPSLRELLWFKEIKSREGAIDCEHDGTCAWFLDSKTYTSWREDLPNKWHHRLLWIKGSVGAGKSTMMKFLVKQTRRTPGELVLPHFFNARGTALEHSTEGMYRTLLYWLLKKLPEESSKMLESAYEHRKNTKWQVPELAEILEAALEGIADRPVTFFIDALDECPSDEIRVMLTAFRKIVRISWSSGRQVRVCLASRPYPHITFTDAIFLDLSREDKHLNDLRQYISDELHIGSSKSSGDIRQRLLSKATGSFIWVVRVVRMLNSEYDGGHVERLRAQLDEIPPDVYDLYAYTLMRYPENDTAFLACCQWMLFAFEDLSPSELWWAARQRMDRDEETTWTIYQNLSRDDMERYIVDISKGLVEFRGGDFPTYSGPYSRSSRYRSGRRAQFQHESVREFALKSNDLWRLCGAEDGDSFAALSHEAIAESCRAVFESQRQTISDLVQTHGHKIHDDALRERLWDDGYGGKSIQPLGWYATRRIIRHAEKAQTLGLDQTSFLDRVFTTCGPYFLGQEDYSGHFAVWQSMIGLLIDQCHSSVALIRETQLHPAQRAWEQGQPFGLVEDGPNSPLIAALQSGPTRNIHALINVYLRLRPYSPTMHVILGRLANFTMYEFGEYIETPWIQNPLLHIAMRRPSLASLVLLVFAADEGLDSHCDSFKDLLDIMKDCEIRKRLQRRGRDIVTFLETLDLFLDKRLSSFAITFKDEELSEWLQRMSEDRSTERHLVSVEEKRKVKSLMILLRRHISKQKSSRICLRFLKGS